MSIQVVINGPLAAAGSIFTLLKKIGIKEPKKLALVRLTASEKDTTIATSRFDSSELPLIARNKYVIPKERIPRVNPVINPKRNSFKRCFIIP